MNEEVRDGYVVTAQMKKIWSMQMRLMAKLLDVCQRNNLHIWVDGGTLLGTIRHHGYIPWDDDLDLVMLRDDYERLLQIAPQYFTPPTGMFFQTAYTDKYYSRGHAQLRLDDTAAVIPTELNCPFHQGIFIDIFVYDALPKNGDELLNALMRAEPLRKLMQWRSNMGFSITNPKVAIRWLLSRIYFAFHDYKKTFTKFQNYYTHYNGPLSDILSAPCYYAASVFKNRHRRKCFSSTLMMPFEDMMVPVPVGYDEILHNYYGDYMTPVKAPSLHGSVIFDTERSYKDVIKELRR